MITERDILRQMVEFTETKYGPYEWAEKQDIDPAGLTEMMGQFSKALWADLYEIAEGEHSSEHAEEVEALTRTLTAFTACFAIGFELGRQYPSTPFES